LYTEWAENGSLESYIKTNSLSLRRKVSILINILEGLRLIHKKNFIHKDIKPDNILLTDSLTVIIIKKKIKYYYIFMYFFFYLIGKNCRFGC
jgi:serine/threonine protein kinase